MIVYLVTNKVNGKLYVGQTIQTLEERWSQHCRCCESKKRILQRAIDKYGCESFDIRILQKCNSVDELNSAESSWIESLQCLSPNGYNLNGGGGNRRPSEETKRKISEGGKRSWQDPIIRANQLAGLEKNHNSPEANRKRALAITSRPGKNLGRKWSDEVKANMRIAHADRKHDALGRWLPKT